MKKNIIIKGLLLALVGGNVAGLTGHSIYQMKDTKNNEIMERQTNIVEKSEDEIDVSTVSAKNILEPEMLETISENVNMANMENTSNEKISLANNKTQETKEETTLDNNKNQVTKEEIATEKYLEELKEEARQDISKLSDYKIEKVEIVEFNEIEKIYPDIEGYYPGAKDSDIFATITYSVKPAGGKDSDEYNMWIVGNGEASGDWIKNKVINVWLVEKSGQYRIESSGTDW